MKTQPGWSLRRRSSQARARGANWLFTWALFGVVGCGDSTGQGGSGASSSDGGAGAGGSDVGGQGGSDGGGGSVADGGSGGSVAQGGGGGSAGKGNGEACEAGNECDSSICASGVCCATVCEGSCSACDLAGSEGACTPREVGPQEGCEGTCDGLGWCESGAHRWSRALGGDGADYVSAVDVAPNGDVVVAGVFSGSVDFGGGALDAQGSDLFVARYSADGEHLWSKRFGQAANESWALARVDGAGDIVIATYSAVDFGGGLPAGAAGLMLAKLDAQGEHVWSQGFAGGVTTYSLEITPDDDLILGGFITGTVSLGGPSLISAGSRDVFVAKLSPTGEHVWSQRYGDAAIQCAGGCYASVDGDGNVFSYGSFDGVMSFGGGNLTGGGGAGFVAKLSPAGAHQWSKAFPGAASKVNQIVADSQGRPTLFVRLTGSYDFGGGVLSSVGGSSLALVRLDAQGSFVQQELFTADNLVTYAATSDAHDNVVFVGGLVGSADFGGGPITSAGFNHFVVKLDADLSHAFSYGYDANGDDSGPNDVSVDPQTGRVFFGGGFDQAASFGGATLTPTLIDGYLVALEP